MAASGFGNGKMGGGAQTKAPPTARPAPSPAPLPPFDWMSGMPFQAIFEQHLVAMATTAAIGLSVANQFVSLMLGTLHDLAPTDTPDKTRSASVTARTSSYDSDEPVKHIASVAQLQQGVTAAQNALNEAVVDQNSPVQVAPAASSAPTARRLASKKKPASAGKANRNDDLKKIGGIGPKIAQVLGGLGIDSYGQIAAWDETEIARINAALGFDGRVERDRWVEQARGLSVDKHLT